MPPITLPIYRRESLDYSVASTHDRCQRLAFFNYVLNRASRVENYPINFGVAYHKFREALEQLYKQWVLKDGNDLDGLIKPLWETAWAVATKDWKDPPLEHKKSYLDFGRLNKNCSEAFDMWLAEKRGGYYKVIGTETPFLLPLPSGRPWTGKFDQIIEWNRRLWVRDFKTVGRKDDWKKKYNPDHQFTGYVWAAQKLSGRQIDGVIVDVVYNIKTKGPEFHPILCGRNAGDIEHWMEWAEDRWDIFERSYKLDRWPMSTTACGDYSGCFFREACDSGSWNTIESWLLEHTMYSEWDPLNPDDEEGVVE